MSNLEVVKSLFYPSDDGEETVEVIIHGETLWATQKSISELFGVDRSVISKHLRNIFNEGELDKDSVCAKIAHTASDGKIYKTNFYNLDAMISVGYRVNSIKATRFRQWSTSVLKEYMVKGYVLDDVLLKNGTRFGKDYFDELLEKIREIRASERRAYQKVTDIFSQCSYDYNPKSEVAREFYAKIQNKLNFAITGHTAAEIISERADSEKEHMGLKTWKNSPDGKILKSDISIAKNYLSEDEIKSLNRLVNMYLDYAENQAYMHKLMGMDDWALKLDSFLEFNDFEVLDNNGHISMNEAQKIADAEFDKFRVKQDKFYQSDFDKLLEDVKRLK